MENYAESKLPIALATPNPNSSSHDSPAITAATTKKKMKKVPKERLSPPPLEEEWQWRRGGEVMLEGYVEPLEGFGDGGSEGVDGVVGRTKSLTDEDLEELKGCLDLGFGFNYDEIPELCSTLPALELCYSMSQRFLDEQQQGRAVEETSGEVVDCLPAPSAPIANWKISSPGDHPDEVKARLKYWAQAVACTVRLCN
ncbi:hypothetical protein J5N97_012650 [Dioscorea zingiberensis]|uniref:Uncharacterized protein n=1 Tax=Dioscorea zingiberensis TaxID=325984 RepID=A0A9D5HHX3_9LILI|nr:hypothetical protein J5N97_012650 [Dioscorea zingiberensis]